jgi:hypothetical protein
MYLILMRGCGKTRYNVTSDCFITIASYRPIKAGYGRGKLKDNVEEHVCV